MRDKIKGEIRRVTVILYSKNRYIEFEKLPRFVLFGRKKSLLITCIATKVATRLDEPLKRSDVDRACKEFNVSMAHFKDETLFNRIVKVNKSIAGLLWAQANLDLVRRRAAHQADEYSYLGATYALELQNRGPISKEQREVVKAKTLEMEALSKKIEELELEELKKSDPAEHARYSQELAAWREKLNFNSPDAIAERREGDELIADFESQLAALLSGESKDFFED